MPMHTHMHTHMHMHTRMHTRMHIHADLIRREVAAPSALDRHERRGGKALPRSRL